MIVALAHDFPKKVRFARSFLRRRLVHVNLQILYDCCYRCRICDFWKPAWRNRAQLSAAQVAVMADKLNEIGPQIVSIGGGEPTLHPELVEIVRALARHHFPVMITNGADLTPDLARALFAAGMVEISVSVDYADPDRHDAQRGSRGAYAQALAALRILQANRTHPTQRVHLITVILDDNLADVEPLIHQCEILGVTYLVTLYSHSRGNKPRRVPATDPARHLLALKRSYRHFVALRGYLERFTEAVGQGGVGPCFAGRHFCNIDSQGNVTFCIDRLSDPVGNLLTDAMSMIAQRLHERQRANACRDCWTSCRGSIESLLYGRRP
jgi:MoaA/NifB/PqqE/SkfB family radical SAM enzyme